MKEQEPNGKDELTRQDNQPRLNGEGMSMTEGNAENQKNQGQPGIEDNSGTSPAPAEQNKALGPERIIQEEKLFQEGPTPDQIKEVWERRLRGDETAEADMDMMMLIQQTAARRRLDRLIGEGKAESLSDILKDAGIGGASEAAFIQDHISAGYYDSREKEKVIPTELPVYQLTKILKTIEAATDLKGLVNNIKERPDDKLSMFEQLDRLIELAIAFYVDKEIVDLSKKEVLKDKLNRSKILLEKLKNADDPTSITSLDEFKEAMEKLIKEDEEEDKSKREIGLMEIFRNKEESRETELPLCLEDLVETIMNSGEDEFKRGGSLALLKENKDGKEEVDLDNLLTWFRSKILYWHSFNSTSEVNLFSEISVYKLYRAINFGEMLYDPRYFMTRTKSIDKDGNEKTIYKKNKKFEDFRDHLLYEVWLFMISHNADIKYRNVMGNDSKVPETIIELYYNNYFTSSKSRLLKILKLPSVNSDELFSCIKEEDEKDAKQGGVGKAIRRILLAYYHIGEIGIEREDGGENMFEKSLGKEGVEEFYKQIYKKIFKNKNCPTEIGKLKSDINEGLKDLGYDGLKDLNIFNAIEKDTTIVEWVREAVAKAVAEKIGLTDKIDVKHDNYLSSNVGYAENWAYSMAYWTGLAARNDVRGIGFDGWSKLQNFLGYRISQLGAERGGKGNYGDVRNFYGVNRICFNLWEGIKASERHEKKDDDHKHTMLFFLQGGEGETVKLDSLRDFEFESNVQRQFAVNHIGYGYQVYTYLMKTHGLDLIELLSHDSYGKVIIKEKEAREKLWDGIFKQIRYTYDIQEPKWKQSERGISWDIDDKGKPRATFETKKLEELFFDDDVIKTAEFMMNRYEKADKSGKLAKKRYKARGVFSYLLEKELRAHRKYFSPDPIRRYSIDEVTAIQTYFMNRPTRIEKIKDKRSKTVDNEKVTDTFYDKEEMREIAKKSKTELSKMLASRVASGTGLSLISSFFEAMKAFFKEIFKF